ncbi:hypothetical protein [Bifidobacterium biavatii]|uniref:Uncharacterized protein n=1 Tax=Bifidobacterium biavatii DSM 23969 TaxID=1437608 RepID=A0A087A4Q8_9BIFI|nr:hypothetical protein [Bifidobacterium biavatii]KFI53758.1 hypothetical protein BBIA_1355 [Bifidobacterium biavatii DSM 23969]
MWINDKGGYDYAIQRISDHRFCANGDADEAWTSDYDAVCLAEGMSGPEYWRDSVWDRFSCFLTDDITAETDDDWPEDYAYELARNHVREGYRLVRLPFLNEELYLTDENGRDYGEGESPFFDEDDNIDIVAVRDYVFGKGGAIALPGEKVPKDAYWAACSAKELRWRLCPIEDGTDPEGGLDVLTPVSARLARPARSAGSRSDVSAGSRAAAASSKGTRVQTSDQSIRRMMDGLDDEIDEYLSQSSWSYTDSFAVTGPRGCKTAASAARALQQRIDGWDYRTMRLKVVRFRDVPEPMPGEDGKLKGAIVFERDSVGNQVQYRVSHLGMWCPRRAAEFAWADQEHAYLRASFEMADDGSVSQHVNGNYFSIHAGFSYDELAKAGLIAGEDDPAGEISNDVLGIWDRTTGWVLPVPLDSVIVWRAFGEGRSNCLDVYCGRKWRVDHRRWALYYGNDPGDLSEVKVQVRALESQLELFLVMNSPRNPWNTRGEWDD